MCDDIGISIYAQFANPKHELKVKDRADLLEAFLGALYIDKDLDYCTKFAEVCFFPRLTHFIVNQEWNDPKSKLQQCCLTLRTMNGSDPDIPNYKVLNQSHSPLKSDFFFIWRVIICRLLNRKVPPTRGFTRWPYTFVGIVSLMPTVTAFRMRR